MNEFNEAIERQRKKVASIIDRLQEAKLYDGVTTGLLDWTITQLMQLHVSLDSLSSNVESSISENKIWEDVLEQMRQNTLESIEHIRNMR